MTSPGENNLFLLFKEISPARLFLSLEETVESDIVLPKEQLSWERMSIFSAEILREGKKLLIT